MFENIFDQLPDTISESELDNITNGIYEQLNEMPLNESEIIETLMNESEEIENKVSDKSNDVNKKLTDPDENKINIKQNTLDSIINKDENLLKKLSECAKINKVELEKIKTALQKACEVVNENSFRNTEARLTRASKRFRHGKNNDVENQFVSKINNKLASDLKRTFELIKSNKHRVLKTRGKSVNVTRYIQSKFTGDQRVFNKIDSRNKLTVTILLDRSGSMQGQNIESAVNLVASIFKSVESMKQIKINVIAYSSNSYHIISSLKEIDSICSAYGSTPTAEIMTTITDKIKLSERNLLLLITDGEPDRINSNLMDVTAYLSKLVIKLKQNKIEQFGFLIGSKFFDSFSKIYGKDFVEVDTMKNAEGKLIEIFSEFITRNLKR